jgi:hypothetical protein
MEQLFDVLKSALDDGQEIEMWKQIGIGEGYIVRISGDCFCESRHNPTLVGATKEAVEKYVNFAKSGLEEGEPGIDLSGIGDNMDPLNVLHPSAEAEKTWDVGNGTCPHCGKDLNVMKHENPCDCEVSGFTAWHVPGCEFYQ